MKILMLVNTYPPEIRSAGFLFAELAEALRRKGHQVKVVTSLPKRHLGGEVPEKYRRRMFLRESLDGIEVLRLAGLPLPRKIPFLRGLEHFFLAIAYFFGALRAGPVDVTLVYSPPLTLGLTAFLLHRWKGAPFVFNVQDIYPQCLVDMGLLKSRLLIRLFEAIERFVYRKAACITVHSDGNGEFIAAKVPDRRKLVTIPNWVDLDQIHPGVDSGPFKARHRLDSRFIVSFAGAMGFAQDLDTVIESARILREFPEILFLLVGEGMERPRLEEKVKGQGLSNVRFLPFQPKEVYPQVLAASQVSLVSLRKELVTPTVPGKLVSILAAGRATLAHLDLKGDVPKIIQEAGCGLCVEPENPARLAEAVLQLYRDPERTRRLGANGRAYAEKHFSLKACTGRYEEILRLACTSQETMKTEDEVAMRG